MIDVCKLELHIDCVSSDEWFQYMCVNNIFEQRKELYYARLNLFISHLITIFKPMTHP